MRFLTRFRSRQRSTERAALHDPRRTLLRRTSFEELETRRMMAVAADEQLFVYLLNRARHDPVAYQQENNLNVDLSYVTPRGPLAVNDQLFNSAEFHSNEMAVNNYFAHQSQVTGDWPNGMARDQGYTLNAAWPDDENYIESLAAGTFYNAAAIPLRELIVDAGIPSLGHRNHLLGIDSFNAGNREIGVGHSFNAAAQYDHYWAIHATRTSVNDRFLTGVAFNDANANGRYDLNEGLAGVTISAGVGLTTTTNAAGGWSIRANSGTYQVTASGGGYVGTGTATAVLNDNVEVDFISGRSQGIVNFALPTVAVSVSDASVAEGSGATVNAVFNVTLSASSLQTVTVAYSTASGTAVAGTDFVAQGGVLTFTPGTLTRSVTVGVSGDLLDENNETFTLNLSAATNASIADALGVGTIVDNDGPIAQPNNILVVAPGPGRPPLVRVLDRTTLAERFSFLAYSAGFTGGVQVATGDVTGDGVLDIVVAPGAGGGPHVQVFDGTTGNVLTGANGSFFAYSPGFTGGIFLAVGDINGDNRADIVTAPGAGGGPHVRIFSGATGGVLGEYLAYGATFTGGVHLAVGNVDGVGGSDVITAPGGGGGPHVRVFSGATGTNISGPLGNFLAYAPSLTGGVWVAAGDLNGDGRADVVTGPGAGGGPHVRAFSGLDGSELASFLAYTPAFAGGVRVATGDFNGNQRADIITAPGSGGGPHVRVFNGQSPFNELTGLLAFEANFVGGVYVAGSPSGAAGAPLTSNPSASSSTASTTSDATDYALLPPQQAPSASDVRRAAKLREIDAIFAWEAWAD